MNVTIDGVAYELSIAELTGLDVRDIRKTTGLRQAELVGMLLEGDMEAIAAFAWVAGRATDPNLTYDGLLSKLSLSDIRHLMDDDNDDEGALVPE